MVCREKRDKRVLTRIVNNSEDGLVIDPSGKKNGRGAYICDQLTCWEKMKSSQVLDKALRVTISPEIREQLFAQFESSVGV